MERNEEEIEVNVLDRIQAETKHIWDGIDDIRSHHFGWICSHFNFYAQFNHYEYIILLCLLRLCTFFYSQQRTACKIIHSYFGTRLNFLYSRFSQQFKTNCCYGLSMDLLENVAEELEFDFQLYVVADGLFGSRTSSENNEIKWNGIMGDLISGAAHMSFSPLSVSSSRLVNENIFQSRLTCQWSGDCAFQGIAPILKRENLKLIIMWRGVKRSVHLSRKISISVALWKTTKKFHQ